MQCTYIIIFKYVLIVSLSDSEVAFHNVTHYTNNVFNKLKQNKNVNIFLFFLLILKNEINFSAKNVTKILFITTSFHT